jgi:hypothetical protein
MAPEISDATLNKDLRSAFRSSGLPANTTLGRGVYGIMRADLQTCMKTTLGKSRTLARYVRNSPNDRFTATDVAVVDYIRGLSNLENLYARLGSDASTYTNFLGRRAKPQRKRPAKTSRSKTPSPPGGSGSPGYDDVPDDNDWMGDPPASPQRSRSKTPSATRLTAVGKAYDMSGYYRVEIEANGDCLFNCLGRANEFVRSSGTFRLPASPAAAKKEERRLGAEARAKIIEFLRVNQMEHVRNPVYRRDYTWQNMFDDLNNTRFENAVPRAANRTYERYLRYMSRRRVWGDDMSIYAGNKVFGHAVYSNMVYYATVEVGKGEPPPVPPKRFVVSVPHNMDHNLPVIEQMTLGGLHYTLWLPKPRSGSPRKSPNPRKAPSPKSPSPRKAPSPRKSPSPQKAPSPRKSPSPQKAPSPALDTPQNQDRKATSGTPVRRPKRSVRRPLRLDDYLEKVDLRKINLKRYEKKKVARNKNNLFMAVKIATGDSRTVAQLRELCAELASTRRFAGIAKDYIGSAADVKRRAKLIKEGAAGGDFELFLLSHITKRPLVVKDGRKLRQYNSPSPSPRSAQAEPALLQVTKFYDALVLAKKS